MHAVIGSAEIDPARVDEAEAILMDRLLPAVKAMNGFVSGTWTRSLDDTRATSMVVFESEQAAKDAFEAAKGMAPPAGAPLAFGTFQIVKVVTQA